MSRPDSKRARKGQTIERRKQRAAKYAIQGRPARKA